MFIDMAALVGAAYVLEPEDDYEPIEDTVR